MTKLRWEFELEDKASAPANRAAQAIRGATQAMRGLNEESRRRGARGGDTDARALRQAETALRGLNRTRMAAMRSERQMAGEILGIFRGIAGAALGVTAAATGISSAFGGVVLQIGRGLAEMVRFRAGAVTTLGALLRPQGGGREMIGRTGAAAFRQTQEIARLTPANESGVIQARQQVAAAGFRGSAERAALAASLDVNALNPNDITAQQRFLLGLGQMRNAPRLQLQDVRQTAEAAGLSQADIMRRAAAAAGVTQRQGETETAYRQRIDAVRSSGQITGQHGVQAVYGTLQAQTGERLGGFARMQGASIGGALSNLEESITGLITSINTLEQLPGVRAATAAIAALGNALNGSSESGRRLQAAIVPVIDSIAGSFGTVFSPERIERFFGGVARLLPQVFQALRLFGGAFVEGLARGLGPLARPGAFQGLEQLVPVVALAAEGMGALVGFAVRLSAAFVAIGTFVAGLTGSVLAVFDFFAGLPQRVTDLMLQIVPMISSVGIQIAQGLIGGIRAGWTTVTEGVTEMASGLATSVRGALGIQSPSRVFAELGGHVAAGMALGIEGGSGDVQRAVNGMVGAPRGLGGRGLGGLTIQTLHIEAHGANSREVVDDIRSQLADIFADSFERAALAGGA